MGEAQGNELQYAMGQTAGGDLLMAFMAAFIGVFIVGMVLSLLMYIMYGLGMSRIAANEGYTKPWLAWLPVANLFLIPISVEEDVHRSMRGRFTKVFGGSYVLAVVLAFASSFIVESPMFEGNLVLFVASIAALFIVMMLPSLLLAYGFYFIVDRYSEHAPLHMAVMILTGGYSVPFQLFRFRNRESLYENEG